MMQDDLQRGWLDSEWLEMIDDTVRRYGIFTAMNGWSKNRVHSTTNSGWDVPFGKLT